MEWFTIQLARERAHEGASNDDCSSDEDDEEEKAPPPLIAHANKAIKNNSVYAEFASLAAEVNDSDEEEEDEDGGNLPFEARIKLQVHAFRKCQGIAMFQEVNGKMVKTCPVAWWKKNKANFPEVYWMARKILAIPASQTSSERVFSTAANIVTKKQARLTARNIKEQLVEVEDSSESDDGDGSDNTSVSTSASDIVGI